MEVELKYSLLSPGAGEAILACLTGYDGFQQNSRKTLEMRAVYYDDSERTLASAGIGYRVRKENETYIATVKWTDSETGNGLSRRREYNVPVSGENPEPAVFAERLPEKRIREIFRELTAVPLFVTSVRRELAVVQYKGALIEVAFDRGEISSSFHGKGAAGVRPLPIRELECELKSGEERDLTEFGRGLQRKFGLEPLNDSKMKRGLELISM